MSDELHILILDDVPTDAELMRFELIQAGLKFKTEYVPDKASFVSSLATRQPDIILSDYSLPSFNGLSALKIAKQKYPDVPFIFVSGALGEETAIELLKQGATDYVLKDRLARLAPAVIRALQEVAERSERRRAEEELKNSEIRYRTIFENTATAMIILEEDMTIALVNKQFEELTGFSGPAIQNKKNWREFIHPDDLDKIYRLDPQNGLLSTITMGSHEFRIINREGNALYVLASIALIPATNKKVLSLRDITQRLEAEAKLLANNEMLRSLSSQLVMAEERERRRIAVNIHDNIGQTLAMTKIKLNALQQITQPDLAKPLEEILEMVDESITQTRSLTRELSPSILYELGLVETLEWLKEQIYQQHGLQIALAHDLKAEKIDKDIQIFIYRSIRELLFNIVKHAKAKKAYIALQKSGRNIRVIVRDSGVGFDVANLDQIFRKGGAFGLLSIRERINYLGGSFEIDSRKEEGTSIKMTLPQKKRKSRKRE